MSLRDELEEASDRIELLEAVVEDAAEAAWRAASNTACGLAFALGMGAERADSGSEDDVVLDADVKSSLEVAGVLP